MLSISASFQLIPSTAILDWQLVATDAELSLVPSVRAKQIYNIDSEPAGSVVSQLDGHPDPLRVAWKCLTDLSIQCVAIATSTPDRSATLRLLASVASLLNALVLRVQPKINTSTTLDWDPKIWTSSMLACLAVDPPFELVDELITLIVALKGFTHIQPAFSLDGRAVLRKLLVPVSFEGHVWSHNLIFFCRYSDISRLIGLPITIGRSSSSGLYTHVCHSERQNL